MYSKVEYIRGVWTRKNIEKFPVIVNGSVFSSDSLDYLIPLFSWDPTITDHLSKSSSELSKACMTCNN